MTLQQKMLAKQSKKGFTLVELVVVIAILAILAAIAIPAVIGIINSASESQGASDASTLNSAVKTFYAGVQSGTINKDSKNSDGNDVTCSGKDAPAKGASQSVRQSAADNSTVEEAAKYSGLYTGKTGDDKPLANFYVAKDGTIKFANKSGDVTEDTNLGFGELKFSTTICKVQTGADPTEGYNPTGD